MKPYEQKTREEKKEMYDELWNRIEKSDFLNDQYKNKIEWRRKSIAEELQGWWQLEIPFPSDDNE